MPKTKIEILPAKTFSIKKGGKYLLILPAPKDPTQAADLKALQPALEAFFGSTKVLAIASPDFDRIKVAEYMED